MELDEVLDYYKNDPEKQEAAKFLIRNMPGKYYLDGSVITEFHHFIDSVFQTQQEYYNENEIYDQYRRQTRFSNLPPEKKVDLQYLKALYLIKQIDDAFRVRQMPWNKDLPFEVFCEWILPYRIGNELPENWRQFYIDRFLETLPGSIGTTREACTVLNNHLIKEYTPQIVLSSVQQSDTRPSSLLNIKFGLCSDYSAFGIFAMRAVGIPVSIGYIPHWGKGNQNHTFNIVYDNDGKFYDFEGCDQNPGEHLKRFEGIPKIYQKTYAFQEQSLAMIHGDEPIPPFFRNPCITDVTGEFRAICPQSVTIPITKKHPHKKYAYLCVFDPAGWSPVDWGSIRNEQVTFKNIGPDIIYQVNYYQDNEFNPLTAPFFVDSTGTLTVLDCRKEKITLSLDRKYRPAQWLETWILPSLVGGKFQGSDFGDFRVVEDLYTLPESVDFKYTTVPVSPRKKYKYYRYLSSPNTQGNIAEIEFYDASDELLKGDIIGTDTTSIYHPEATKYKVFDGDALTYFHTRDSFTWVGMHFAAPTLVNKIRYIVRNDDNGIRKNNLYELFYIDEAGVWESAGKKTADQDDMIQFDSVPAGTLYWLRNYTRGKEERIFTYENGKQIWW